MTRVKSAVTTNKRRKTVLKKAKGFFGNKSRLFRYAKDAYMRASHYSYRDRRKKKSYFRREWISKINQHLRLYGFKYSNLIFNLRAKGFKINRSSLYKLAVENSLTFKFFAANMLS